MENRDKRYEKFVKELEKLSKTYGVVLSGDVEAVVDNPNEIHTISYTNDWRSGDLWSRVIWKN